MRDVSYIQWCNENVGRAYPLAETASRKDDSGNVMPDNILLDMCLLVPPIYASCQLSSMRVTNNIISFSITTGGSGMFVFTSGWTNLQTGSAYPLSPVIEDVSGWVVLNQFEPSMVGYWRFTSSGQSEIETRALRIVDSLPIRSIVRKDMDPMLYMGGVIKLQSGSGVQIVQDSINPQKILVRLTADAKMAMLGGCNNPADAKICGVPPLRSINGVCPDEDGKLTIRFE